MLLLTYSSWELFWLIQGTTVRVELRDATTAADPSGEHTIKRFFPHTYGQPLAHFLRATAKVPDAQIITEHPAIRYCIRRLLYNCAVHSQTRSALWSLIRRCFLTKFYVEVYGSTSVFLITFLLFCLWLKSFSIYILKILTQGK